MLLLNKEGLVLAARAAKIIPWHEIDSATVTYNPAFPSMRLAVRLKVSNVARYSFLPLETGWIPRTGIINISFRLMDDSPKFFAALSARLGDRLHP